MDILGISSTTGAVLVFGITLLSIYFLTSRRNLPPGPWGHPILGHVTLFMSRKPAHLALMAYKRTYGDVFRLRFGQHPAVVLCSPKVIKEALVEKAGIFSERPDWMPLVNAIFKNQGILFNLNNWHKNRKFAVSAMRDFGVGKSSVEEKCAEEIDVLTEEFTKHGNKPFNCMTLMPNAISNIICQVIFNKRFDYDDATFKMIMGMVSSNFKENILYSIPNTIPFVFRIGMQLRKNEASQVMDRVEAIMAHFRNQIDEHRETFDPNNIQDFTDLYLLAQEESSNLGMMVSEKEACQMMLDLFGAGTETTSTTLLWMFIHMMYNQEMQEKCRKEIHQVIGPERAPRTSDRGKMIYTEATLLEVQRIGSIAPLSVPHTTSQDTTVGGYAIPKGTMVIPFLYSCHHDYDIWGDPENFRPERWIDDKGALRKHEAYMPFSIGKRACAGESLARMEIFLFSVALLQRFRFKMADTPPSLLGDLGTTLIPKPFEMIAERLT